MTAPEEKGHIGQAIPESIFELSSDAEVADELAFHVDMRARELIAAGIAPDSARRMAQERFQDFAATAKECQQLAQQREHAVKRTRYLTNLVQDIHFALRMLRRRPAFALLAIVTMALGIGAATAIYSVVDAVMLRPLPFNDPGKLVAVWITEQRFRADPTLTSWWDHIVVGANDYHVLQTGAHTLNDVALWSPGSATLIGANRTEQVSTVDATSNMLQTLRVRPALGRGFLPGEDMLNGPPVAMISWEAWHDRWNGDSAILGRSLTLGSQAYTVVGVLPRGLRMDRSAPIAPIWLPALQDSDDIVARHNRNYHMLARLVPGHTLAQATVEASRLFHASAASWGGPDHANGVAGRVEQWQVDQTRGVRASLWILAAAVALLLLIACANVATLMLGEAVRREPEIAARASLGAGPSRIARQLMTESLTIAVVAAILGMAIGWAATRLLVALAPAGIPGITDVRLDSRVLSFAIVCALITGVMFGLVPAMMLLRRGTRTTVRIGAGQTTRGNGLLQYGIISAEIALSLMLLVGCSLLGHSLLQITEVNPGFRASNLLVVNLTQRRAFWTDDDRKRRYFNAAIRELDAIPGVASVTTSSSAPFAGGGSSSGVKVDTKTYVGTEDEGNSQQRAVMPGYFRTMGIPILAGRPFDSSDRNGGELSMIVSETEARRDWPDASPIGHRLFWRHKWRTVVGLAGDTKYRDLSSDAEPMVYVPFDQDVSAGSILVRTRDGAGGVDAAIRQRLAPLDPAASVETITPMTTIIGQSYAEERYRALLSSLFGVLASVLATVGIFGVISRTVARRTRESGIRLALGAPAPALVRLMMRDGMISTAIGLAVGLIGALAVSHLLTPFLFGVSKHDPLAFAGSVLLLILAALIATVPPARRAGRVDPALVLRSE